MRTKALLLILTVFIAACSSEKKSESDSDSSTTSLSDSSGKADNEIKTILFFGNSLTAGYGLDDPNEAFPGVIQHTIDSLKLPYKIVNAGLSGETTAGGKGRIDWILKQKVDVFVLELGANDGLRGIPVTETSNNLQAILDKVKAKYPDAKQLLLGMQVPPNMGGKYAGDFRAVFPNLAQKNNIPLVSFMLEGVAGDPKLNQRDGIHPTEEGAKIVAENVWEVLKDMLK